MVSNDLTNWPDRTTVSVDQYAAIAGVGRAMVYAAERRGRHHQGRKANTCLRPTPAMNHRQRTCTALITPARNRASSIRTRWLNPACNRMRKHERIILTAHFLLAGVQTLGVHQTRRKGPPARRPVADSEPVTAFGQFPPLRGSKPPARLCRMCYFCLLIVNEGPSEAAKVHHSSRQRCVRWLAGGARGSSWHSFDNSDGVDTHVRLQSYFRRS
jgi:hypothetical protein